MGTRVPMEQIEMTEPWSRIDEVAKTWEGRDSSYRWIEARGMPAHEIGRLWKFKLSHLDDCPREREMIPQLYERFLKLVDEVCKRVPGLQVVLTTTTPPSEPLRDEPTRILKLSHASDDDLLLKRRIENLLARAIPSSRDEEEDAS